MSGAGSRRVPCELLGTRVALPARPRRVVSMVAGWTEAIWAMGLADRVAAVSGYCSRYVDTGGRPVAGDYLRIDEAVLTAVRPDLVLMTGGVQLGVARRLAAAGWPVVVLPVPDSWAAVRANIRRMGALLGELGAAHALEARLAGETAALRVAAAGTRPVVYAELWFGRHVRMAGGMTFVHDLIELAGGRNLWGEAPEGYLKLDTAAVAVARPDVVVVFWEEDDHMVEVPALLAERGWTGAWPFRVVEAGIARGRNLIHDGPSLLETARWLREAVVSR